MLSLELFSGGGGLALGIENAGFRHVALVENDHDSCETLRYNSGSSCIKRAWPVFETDVEAFNFNKWAGKVHLLAGGPPCQPFSIGGKHEGNTDRRNMFPQAFRAMRTIRPQVMLVENVKGLARDTFKPYLEYICLQMQYPTITPNADDDWKVHKERLSRLSKENAHIDLKYDIIAPKVVNLVNYGIPQNRHRLFILAFRSDLNLEWSWPKESHSKEALFYSQWVSGEYWEKHDIPQPPLPTSLARKIRKLGERPATSPWATVRDALHGLPEPIDNQEYPGVSNHTGIPGARSYHGHSGSPFDFPAKTLKAGDHGVPGGENTLLKEDGEVRYFTVRESARIQTFPDEYIFCGSRTESMRQIGNAVPVNMARIIAQQLNALLAPINRHANKVTNKKQELIVPLFASA